MKKSVLLALLFLSAFCVADAQSGKNLVVDANAEVRTLSGFSSIEISGAIDLYLSQGNTEAVAISASSDEIRERIRTEVRSGTLHIYFDGKGLNWKIWGNNRMKAYVTFQKLERLESSGACNIRATDPIRQPELKMELSGASDFTGELSLGMFRLNTSGASNVKLNGKVGNMVLDASGASTIKAYDLQTDMCKVDASGASSIRITVNKELNATASGGSDIAYRGAGLIRDISSSGGASVKRRNEE